MGGTVPRIEPAVTDFLQKQREIASVALKASENHGFALYVKLSDFGLVKIKDSSLTRTDTSIKGMYNRPDPQLESYKDYAMPNEIHAAGWIINFIFSGKDSLDERNTVWPIVRKATSSSIKERYKDESELWEALNSCIEERLPTQEQLPPFPQKKRIF